MREIRRPAHLHIPAEWEPGEIVPEARKLGFTDLYFFVNKVESGVDIGGLCLSTAMEVGRLAEKEGTGVHAELGVGMATACTELMGIRPRASAVDRGARTDAPSGVDRGGGFSAGNGLPAASTLGPAGFEHISVLPPGGATIRHRNSRIVSRGGGDRVDQIPDSRWKAALADLQRSDGSILHGRRFGRF